VEMDKSIQLLLDAEVSFMFLSRLCPFKISTLAINN
jgi:hypothetical protein